MLLMRLSMHNFMSIRFAMVYIYSLLRFGRSFSLKSNRLFSILFSNPTTYQTFPGVEAGDIGAKCGWNGLDNG